MADEARLHELLDLVEQARAEGDKDTESKAMAAYKRESAQAAAPAPVPQMPAAPSMGGGYMPSFMRNLMGKSQDVPEEYGRGLTAGDLAKGVPEVALQAGTGLVAMPVAGFSGMGTWAGNRMGLTDKQPGDVVRSVQEGMTYQPRSTTGRILSRGVSLPGELWSQATTELAAPLAEGNDGQPRIRGPQQKLAMEDWIAKGRPRGEGSPLLAAALKTFGDVAAPGVFAKRAATAPRGRYTQPKPAEVPTTEQLKAASSNAYKASEEAGVVIAPESTLRIIDMINRVAKSENLGRLPPKLSEAKAILTERYDKSQPLSLRDADKVRQLINDAKKSTDAADQRLAKILQEDYDEFLTGLKPDDVIAGNAEAGLRYLGEARSLYKRRKNSELVDEMEHDAGLTGSTNYTQAGAELALRREFLRLAKNEREMKRFTPEQRRAIERVADPGRGANALRNIGKFDPTRGGVPAFMASILGGGSGAVLAGPTGAFLGPTLLGGAAHMANRAAAKITKSNVERAREALVGRGLPGATQRVPASTSRRSVSSLRDDLLRLDAAIAALPKNVPANDPYRLMLAAETERLRKAIAAGESSAVSP